jgi:hypothetical protein
MLIGATYKDLYPMQGTRDCIQRKAWGMGPYAGVDYYSHYLNVNSVVSYPLPLQKESGREGKISPIGWAHLYLFANVQNNKLQKGEYGERGRKGVRADLMSLNRHFMEHGQPHA